MCEIGRVHKAFTAAELRVAGRAIVGWGLLLLSLSPFPPLASPCTDDTPDRAVAPCKLPRLRAISLSSPPFLPPLFFSCRICGAAKNARDFSAGERRSLLNVKQTAIAAPYKNVLFPFFRSLALQLNEVVQWRLCRWCPRIAGSGWPSLTSVAQFFPPPSSPPLFREKAQQCTRGKGD